MASPTESLISRAKFFELLFVNADNLVQKKTVFFNGRATVGEIVESECKKRGINFGEVTLQVSSPSFFERSADFPFRTSQGSRLICVSR